MDYDGFETETSDHRWKKVVHRKRNRKQKPAKIDVEIESNVARNENLKAEEIKKTKPNTEKMPKVSLPEAAANIDSESEKPKPDKEKMPTVSLPGVAANIESESEKPKEVSLAEAAAKIDPSHLAAFLADSPNWYPGIEVLELVDYFGKALSGVSSVQFKYPWPKMNKLIDVIDLPFTHIPRAVYKTAADWLNHQVPNSTVCAFVMWSFGFTRARLTGERTAPKSQLGVFVALSIILRSKPVVMCIILPLLREAPYQTEDAHDMFPFTVWLMGQATQVDLCVGLYSWSRNLLPLVGNKNKCNPQSMDLILQLVEKILSHPNARTIILRNALRDEVVRLIPMSSFEILLQLTFPDSSDRVKDTERFEAVYPLLKEVALADAPGRKEMKIVTQQIFIFSLKLAGEATSIAIWCVTKNVDCCHHWNNVYKKNPEGSVAVLKKLVDEWKDHSLKLSSSPRDTRILKRTMKSFVLKNKKGITEGGVRGSLYKEADKYSKEISWRLSRGIGFLKGVTITAVILVAVGAAAPMVLSSNLVRSFGLHEYVNAITTALMN